MPRWPKRKPREGVDNYGCTPLWHFAIAGDLEGVKREIASGAHPSVGDDVGYTPLHAAVQTGHMEVIDCLIESGADLNKTDKHGNSPLWTALLSSPAASRNKIITRLLSAGANPHHKNRYGRSPYELAMEIKHGLDELFSEQ
jgi:ankyrin repeat protein